MSCSKREPLQCLVQKLTNAKPTLFPPDFSFNDEKDNSIVPNMSIVQKKQVLLSILFFHSASKEIHSWVVFLYWKTQQQLHMGFVSVL